MTLTKLQQKSDAEKTVIAFTIAISVTTLLFLGWGYNFAHSGKIRNLANSVSSVADVVGQAKRDSKITTTITQFSDITSLTATQNTHDADTVSDTERIHNNATDSVGAQYVNVFQEPESGLQHYGDNPGDVLY